MHLAPGILFMQTVGTSSFEIDKLVFDEIDRNLLERDKIILFGDTRGQTRLGRETRDFAGEWSKKHGNKVESHLLVSSRFVEMALSIIAMVSGNSIKMYSTEERFVKAIQKVVPSFRGLAALPTVA